MKILINGAGNIGTTLANMLLAERELLGIGELYVAKHSPKPWLSVDLELLAERGAVICHPEALALGAPSYEEVLREVDFVFDCGAQGSAHRRSAEYDAVEGLRVCAQGSEKGFGAPFMAGVNGAVIEGAARAQVVSCNTHGTASVLQAFAGEDLGELVEADVVVVRRAEDLGNHARQVSANVVARHLDGRQGTHHGIDVCDLFATIDRRPMLRTSDVTTPSQLMHAARFSITLKEPLSETPQALIARRPYLATTQKFDSNFVFELGRRYGFQGRLYSHAIIVAHDLLIEDCNVRGWMFVPQEGNTILSTVEAYLRQTKRADVAATMATLRGRYLRASW